MWIAVLFGLEVLGVLTVLLWGRVRYADLLKAQPYPFRFKRLFPYSYLLVDRLHVMDKMPALTSKLHHKLIKLHGSSYAAYGSKWLYAELLSTSTICLLLSTLLSALAGGDESLLGFGVLLSVMIPAFMVRDLDVRIRKKQQQMIMELPEVLSTIVLLVNAGETVNRAWIRCVEARPHKAHTPLYRELAQAVHELEMNISFAKVMEDFSKRCALHEVSLFTSAILLNYKRGGSDFVMALQALSLDLWQRRKSVARTLGEEASSKLVFPMVLIFVVVMIIVATPALLMMKS
ncbi:type II secretion system F family protein [Bacillus sp. 3255]|uniref:type II secretion system F family protein n=1 Tax=Bacillus sp. 3255 TaxID=2817904 RepID=UPI002860C43A|nr:type II secretion system F family protein [Bacillus sp. 3255]MDR6882305.1 tight adherence protein C [Bacillus sp. 3255]